MRIGTLAERTGVSVRSLRYYESVGLLSSERSPRGQRYYTGEAVDRVVLIQELLAAGLCSHKIARLLPQLESGSSATATELIDELMVQRRRLDDSVRDMLRARDVVDGLLERVRNVGRLDSLHSAVPAVGDACCSVDASHECHPGSQR